MFTSKKIDSGLSFHSMSHVLGLAKLSGPVSFFKDHVILRCLLVLLTALVIFFI